MSMAGRGLQRSRFVFCLFVLFLNIGVQLFLWLTFSFMSLPELGQLGTTAGASQPATRGGGACSCPPVEPAPAQCGAPGDEEGGRVGPEDGEVEGGLVIQVEGKEKKRKHYLLVVIVLSSVRGRDRRNTIRGTWMKDYQHRTPPVLVRFTIGTLQLPTSDLQALTEEQAAHGDLVLLPGLKEDYANLTRKVLQSLVWADTHLNFSYLMKCDDDTFVVMDTVLAELAARTSRQSYYWGFFDGRATPKRSGKWAEKGWFLCDRYLPYALGGGYVLSADLVHRIAANADGLQLYNSEDVSVGVWLSPYEAERHHDVRFNTEWVSRGCRNVYIVSHKQSLQDMLSKHRLLISTGRQCDKEVQTRPSYEYNWEEVASKCCERKPGIP